MPDTVVYLFRHSIPVHPMVNGKLVQYGPVDPLSEEGRKKAAKLAPAILVREGRPLDAVYSSPFKRAFETATILAEPMGIKEVKIIDGLRDTDSDWGGVPVEELMAVARANRIFEDPRTHETLAQISERMRIAYNQIVEAHPGQLIGVVSHGDPIRLLYFWLKYPGKKIPPYAKLVSLMTPDTAGGFRVEIGGENQVEIEIV